MTWEELHQQLGDALKANPSLASDEARFLTDWTDYQLYGDEENGKISDDDIDSCVEIIDNIEHTKEGTITLTS